MTSLIEDNRIRIRFWNDCYILNLKILISEQIFQMTMMSLTEFYQILKKKFEMTMISLDILQIHKFSSNI